MGHGLQRSYLLALLQELAGSEAPNAPTLILGCEEPELYQHPPQARHLADADGTFTDAAGFLEQPSWDDNQPDSFDSCKRSLHHTAPRDTAGKKASDWRRDLRRRVGCPRGSVSSSGTTGMHFDHHWKGGITTLRWIESQLVCDDCEDAAASRDCHRHFSSLHAGRSGLRLVVRGAGCVLFRPYMAEENCLGALPGPSLQPGPPRCAPSMLAAGLWLY